MRATRMLFRTFKGRGFRGDVDAFIPDAPANAGFCVCYSHIGQHSEASRGYYLKATRPATPAERLPLVRELQRIYGPIRILRRMPRR